jgi:hypothetical protein
MKQIATSKNALLLILLLTVASSFSFAGTTEEGTPRLRASFQHDFKNASLISAEVHEKLIKVTFAMDKTILCAYYSTAGKLLGVVHNILSGELPADLKTDLKESYGKYWITELFEINEDAQSVYYVSLQNADHIVNLRSTDQGWEVYSRVKKN